MFSFFLIPILLLVNFALFFVCQQSFNYLLASLNSFAYYRDARMSLVFSRYMRLMTNTSIVNDSSLALLKDETTANIQTILQISKKTKIRFCRKRSRTPGFC